jgi:hypothetical protein
MRMSALALVAPILLAAPARARAAEVVDVPAFQAIELNDGGHVTVRHGATQRVTLIEGSRQYTRFVMRDHTLRIENCYVHCPRGYRLQVEIVTPSVLGLAVNDGGMVRAEGAFQEQDSVAAAVSDGGIVDARAIPGRSVAAAVSSGGRVLVTARANLAAHVQHGGIVTFWGDPRNIAKAVSDGGAITRGAPGDANKPLSGLSPRAEAAPPPVPPVPPVPPMGEGDEDEDD